MKMLWLCGLLLLNGPALAVPQLHSSPQREGSDRDGRQSLGLRPREDTDSSSAAANCDFNVGINVDMCSWDNLNNVTALRWLASKGSDAFWIGGPRVDSDSSGQEGGYVFFETSTLPESDLNLNTEAAMLESPLLASTGSGGHCVSFSYSISGLSADRLRVLLHPVDVSKDPEEADFSSDVLLATLIDDTRGEWKKAQVMYTFPEEHTLILEAVPRSQVSQSRRYRGHIAVDSIQFRPGFDCKGHCTFDSGLCGFSNDPNANFQWQVGRGSNNPNTGPQRDHSSFATNRITGAFAYIDSSFPRRPGDKAHLVSEQFGATDTGNGPLCLRFWTHMYGNGIGALNVFVRGATSGDKKIWGLTGDAGNNWYMGQVPIASSESFQIVFEGVVGRNILGNIAIDDISMAPGVCPTAPQVAASSPGDCSFEDDECGWSNPDRREGVDELNWERVSSGEAGRFPESDHTTGTESGFYMSLSRDSIQKAGDRAFLVSREMTGSSTARCISFWYYMYEPIVDTAGPNLGKLAVWTRTIDRNDNLVMTPVWRMHNGLGPSWYYAQAEVTTETNFQVMIEGIWGNNRASGFIAVDDITFFEGSCPTEPSPALVIKGECTFDRDSCGWRNTSTAENFDWRMATLTKRPANLPDKTYGAPVGYAYFDIFNTGSRTNRVKLISPTLDTTEVTCFSFWFAAFGAGDTTVLKIYREPVSGDDSEDSEDDKPGIWELSAAELDTARPDWSPGQVNIVPGKDFRLVIEGRASNGGFALDQVSLNLGSCSIRPESADPQRSPRN